MPMPDLQAVSNTASGAQRHSRGWPAAPQVDQLPNHTWRLLQLASLPIPAAPLQMMPVVYSHCMLPLQGVPVIPHMPPMVAGKQSRRRAVSRSPNGDWHVGRRSTCGVDMCVHESLHATLPVAPQYSMRKHMHKRVACCTLQWQQGTECIMHDDV